MINSQKEGVVSNVHFCRTVTSEYLVIKYWITFVVCCVDNRIERVFCHVNITERFCDTVDSLSDFQIELRCRY